MPVLSLKDVDIYLGGADLSAYSNAIQAEAKIEADDATTFASQGWRERQAVSWDSSGIVEGFYGAGDAGKPDDEMWSDLGQSPPLTVIPTGGAVGDLAYLTKAYRSSWKSFGKIGALMPLSGDWQGAWPVARGQILHPQGTARTASGSGTAVQLGALTSAQHLYVCLHVFSVSGTASPTLTVAVQSDDAVGFASPTVQGTFSAATAIGGQTLRINGPITDTYWRVAWTISGTTPSFLFAVSAGIAV